MDKRIETTELTDHELDAIAGGGQICFDFRSVGGQAGCANADSGGKNLHDLFNDWAQRGRDLAAGQTKF